MASKRTGRRRMVCADRGRRRRPLQGPSRSRSCAPRGDPTIIEQLAAELEGVPMLPFKKDTAALALRAQSKLARSAQHRGPKPVDLLIAAVAESHGVVLLHYDRHFDAIVRATGQPAQWLAKRGSLD